MKKHIKRYAICVLVQGFGLLMLVFGAGCAWGTQSPLGTVAALLGFAISIFHLGVTMVLAFMGLDLSFHGGVWLSLPLSSLIPLWLWHTSDDKCDKNFPNKTSDATSEPAGADSSSHQG